MYIGPWQEYKLAQVIKVKNDLYEGASDNQSMKHPRTHDSLNLSNHSNVSTPSTRTFSSEPIQRAYPKFAIDRYYEQWRKVEHLMSMPNEVHRKPPLPKLQVRQRQGRSIQEKRVSRMRVLYGFNKPPEPDPAVQDSPKISFVDKLKNQVKKGEAKIQDKKEFKEDERNNFEVNEVKSNRLASERLEEQKLATLGKPNKANKANSNAGELKPEEKLSSLHYSIPITKPAEDLQEEHKQKFSSIDKRYVHEEKEPHRAEPLETDDQRKFTCLASISELDLLEESINHEGVDGLLQWVENLPDEVSSTMKDYRDVKSRENNIIM